MRGGSRAMRENECTSEVSGTSHQETIATTRAAYSESSITNKKFHMTSAKELQILRHSCQSDSHTNNTHSSSSSLYLSWNVPISFTIIFDPSSPNNISVFGFFTPLKLGEIDELPFIIEPFDDYVMPEELDCLCSSMTSSLLSIPSPTTMELEVLETK
ncbi:hypothetical protein L6452_37743 [Arctium lappa]|uniref:Uncharacterized protein n=1 Tax=Arctium lappa TaxID=4217 RepID=A0ACB8Y7Z0_ARCLA|nr:hypothetical protein L6452_37743 [Arctium lappa]